MRPLLSILALAALSAPAFAATDGAIGVTSTGSFTVTAEVAAAPQGQVRISGLSDIDMGVFTTSSGTRVPACFFHTSPTFSLTFFQQGGSEFVLTGPGGATVPVEVFTSDLPGQPFAYLPGVPVTGLVGNTTSETCSTGPTSFVGVTAGTIPDDAPDGAYQAVISVTMAAE